MNIVNSGSKYVVYGDEVKTFQTLPAETFRVCFSQQEGFFLVKHNDLTVDEKIYGPYVKKVEKVINTYTDSVRNLGIILSGPKGVGKSVFARLLSEEGKKRGLPTIIVDIGISGVASFISSIEQECIVLFDEFEKMFKDDEGQQDRLLSLFDGIDSGKKLFIITCNKTYELSEYLLNRPGRFHYHFMLGSPSQEDAKEYLEDNLVESAKGSMDSLLQYHLTNHFTYDVLRAIIQELNRGYTLKETLQDLNVEKTTRLRIRPVVKFNNGAVAVCSSGTYIDMDCDRTQRVWMEWKTSSLPEGWAQTIQSAQRSIGIVFENNAVKCNPSGYFVNPENVYLLANEWTDSLHENDNLTEEEKNAITNFMLGIDASEITSIELNASFNSDSWDARKFDF